MPYVIPAHGPHLQPGRKAQPCGWCDGYDCDLDCNPPDCDLGGNPPDYDLDCNPPD